MAILGATLQISLRLELGASGGQITIDGGTLEATSGFDLSAPLVLGQGGGTIDVNGCDVELDGDISGQRGADRDRQQRRRHAQSHGQR